MARYSTEHECKTLSEYAAKAKLGIVEIGVLDGETTKEIAKNATVPICGIDPLVPDSMNAGLIGHEQSIRENMKGYDKFTFIRDFSYNAVKTWNKPIDMVFVDGDHTYDAVKKDIEDWWKVLPIGGRLFVHDSAPVTSEVSTFKGHASVIMAVEEIKKTGMKCIGTWDTITGFEKDIEYKINRVIGDIKKGIPIIVVDDYDRENEGDLVIAGEKATCENLALMKKEAGGLMCVPVAGKILDRLKIPMMVENSTDPHGTPFTVTVDALMGTSTGMCVSDRLKAINVILNESSKPEELSRPGHMFPLRPRNGLLKERKGHTEASIELVKLAGLKEVSIIIEIMNPDGSMAKMPELEALSKKNNLTIISVKEIIDYVYNASV